MGKIQFATDESIDRISLSVDEKKSGITFIHNGKKILNNNYHTLIIGEDDIQKEEKIINPLIEQISSTGESIFINKKSSRQYNKYKSLLEDKGYKVVCINLDDIIDSDSFNILELAYNLYKDNNLDKAIEILENVGYYIFYDEADNNSDPYWINSSISFFTGCAIYMFDNSKEININKILEISDNLKIEDIAGNSILYNYLSSILMAPIETKGSIISVFKQKLNRFIFKTNLNNSTFNINDIINGKLAIFVIEGISEISKNITPLIINQIYHVCNLYNNTNKINVIIDDFDKLCPIKNIGRIISLFTGLNVNVTAFINNFDSLDKIYGKESSEILKLNFKNLIYLYSEHIPTMKYISELCGDTEYISNLRNLKEDEALFIIVRMFPFIANI